MTLSEFRARFPEFRTASDTLAQVVLDEAADRVAPEIFGDLTAVAIGHLAAHLLATSPMGTNQRLEDDKTETIHLKNYRAILRQKAPRFIDT